MSYDFNADDSELNNVPNPFKKENIALLSAATLLIACGISILFNARSYIGNHQDKAALAATTLSVGLFGVAIKFGAQALSQLRFVLGRKFPKGLADELAADGKGMAPGALAAIKTLRQSSIELPEPKGSLNGLLYALAKPLGAAPAPIQFAAVKHFHTIVISASLLLSMLTSFVLFRQSPYEGLVSWTYLPMAGFSLFLPLTDNADEAGAPSEKNTTTTTLWKLIGLIAFSVLAPVLLPRLMPAYIVGSSWLAPMLFLAGILIASCLFLAALFARLDQMSQTHVSCDQTSLSMNCHPSQLWIEAKRNFQNNWVGGIPNRVYAHVPPGEADTASGLFQGYLFEETQPIPVDTINIHSSSKGVSEKYQRHLLSLSVWGLIMAIAAALAAICTVPMFGDLATAEISRTLLIVLALVISSIRAFSTGHLLWSRIYFKSRLVLILLDGTFQSAELSIGNQFTDHVQSKSMLTRIEKATLRVWVADISSVAFGKEARRSIIAMEPADGFAKATSEILLRFAHDQSLIAAPTSRDDLEKVRTLRQFNATFSERGTAPNRRSIPD